MSEHLPYEEQLAQQLNDIPLPDENMAWADMKRRLEDDDDNTIIPFWLRGCGLWGLLAIVLLALGWWMFRQRTHSVKKEETQKVQTVPQQQTDLNKNTNLLHDSIQITNRQPGQRSNENKPIPRGKNSYDTASGTKQSEPGKYITKENSKISVTVTNGNIDRKKNNPKNKTEEVKDRKKKDPKRNQVMDKDSTSITSDPGMKSSNVIQNPAPVKNNTSVIPADSLSTIPGNIINPDTTHIVLKDSIEKKTPEETAKNNLPKKDSSKPKSTSFSAGIAFHQLLPIAGQKLTPYNAEGRKGSLADYIPSVYFRMNKNNKWFLQSEFRYGAPQYNREILYRQKGKLDTFGITDTITSTRLKKTFYHQLPVSFNYFVLPNFSVGTGFVWNKFKAAVSAQDVVRRTVATGSDTIVSQGTILNSRGADSNFAKSYFQAFIETQYKWKRFSLGVKYSFGLQPYLKFTLPGGVQQREKNKSIQLFLRYELWRSEKKKK